ncbi:MAG: tetratricopeptide repeat protein [Bacteroidota bacterium]
MTFQSEEGNEDRTNTQNSIIEHAWQLANDGKTQQAEQLFFQALAEDKTGNVLPGVIKFLVSTGQIKKADLVLDQSVERAEKSEDFILHINSLTIKGQLLQMQEDYAGAQDMFEKTLVLEEKLDRPESKAFIYENLGNIVFIQGNIEAAEKWNQKALDLYSMLEQFEGMANQYGNLGIIYHTRGDLSNAKRMYEMALELNGKLGRLEGMASDYGHLGMVYNARKDFIRAQEMYQKTLEINKRLGRYEGMASDYGNLGNVLHASGDLTKAKESYEKALELAEQYGLTQIHEIISAQLEKLQD